MLKSSARRTHWATVATLFIVSLSSSAPAPAQQSADANHSTRTAPRLIVMITVDQLHPGYFDRFGHQLSGGLARLVHEGAVFTNAYQDHAITETAPGHASILSGRFPYSTGIVMNSAGVYDAQAPLIQSGDSGASPYRFRGSTLTDWLRTKDPRTRALSVSRKDRGAIFPIGRAKQDVYWYARNGRFTTSRYYRDTLPDWVKRFNERHRVSDFAGKSWTPLLSPENYPELDTVSVEGDGRGNVFPHVLAADTAQAARALYEFPWMDELTLEMTLEGLAQTRIGMGPQTDVLSISLSTTDAIGHRFGPDSKEIHDQILRVDQMLARFMDSLFVLRDRSTIAIALTADHGVAPFPQLASKYGRVTGVSVDLGPLVQLTRDKLAAAGVSEGALGLQEGMVTVDRAAFAKQRVNVDSTVNAFLAAARRVPGVARADRLNSLRARSNDRDVVGRRWLHMIPPDLPVEAVITLAPYNSWGRRTYARHGSPYDYDAHVPLIFYGDWFKPGKYPATVRVVDIAPTLAWIAQVKPTERLDGRVLRSALK